MNLADILKKLRNSYCGNVGAQFTHVYNSVAKEWIQRHMESQEFLQFSDEERKQILRHVVDAATFGDFCAEKFDTKRFGLDGGESFIPGMQALVEQACTHSVKDIVIGIAHRGR